MRFYKLGVLAVFGVTLALATTASAEPKGSSALARTNVVTPKVASRDVAAAPKRLGLKRLVMARGIDGHEPEDASTTFKTKEDRVYAFVELDNPKATEEQITVVFQPPSGPAFTEIPLKVGSLPRFRTWAFTRRAHEPGEWTVVVRDAKGHVLGRQTFIVEK